MMALSPGRWCLLSIGWLAGVVAVAVATLGDYGITWDEEYYKEYGVVLLNWYTSLGRDQEALSKWGLNYYGGFFDLLAQIAVRFSSAGVYETRHAVSLVFGLVGLAATYGIGWRLGGHRAGFFSLVALTLTPVYYFFMFSNAKDTPFAAMFALSLFFMLCSLRSMPKPSWRLVLAIGVSAGLAMAVRVAGVVLLGYVALLWSGWLLFRRRSRALGSGRDLLRSVAGIGVRLLSVAAVAWGTMVAFWPWAQVSPLLHPIQALRQTTNYDWPLSVLFDGRYIKASQLPPTYIPTWLGISMPEFYLLSLGVGILLAAGCVRRMVKGHGDPDAALGIGLLVLVVVVPIAAHAILRSTIYDGLRQFLFVIPAMAVLAGCSVSAFLRLGLSTAPRLIVALLMAGSAGLTVVDMAELHPYQYVYFNRLIAGGVVSASTRFETDYYGASYREGVRWLAENYHHRGKGKVRVANPSMNFLTAYYLESHPDLRSRFHPVRPWDNPNIYMSTTRWNQHKEKPGRVLHVVTRKGVPLLYVVEVTPPGEPDLA